jgi:adenosine kinase
MSFPGRFREHILADRLEKLSLSFLVDSMKRQRGGCAANIAYTIALLGERPWIMATVGQDFAEYRRWLDEHGIDTSAIVEIPEEFTASFFVNTDQEQNQIATFYTGAMAYARQLSFHNFNAPVDMAVISPNDPEAMARYTAECKSLNIPYLYDPSQQVVRVSPEQLKDGVEGATLLIVNDYEFELLKERTGMTQAQICENVKQAVIVTRGAEGSCIWARDQHWEPILVPIVPPVQILDPTGVGDAYRAGLLKGLALHLPWAAAGRIGSLAAAYVLEQYGPQTHSYTRADFIARYRSVFGEDEVTTALA